jgi:putative hydroxymethylpyrimidine transport system permease protein
MASLYVVISIVGLWFLVSLGGHVPDYFLPPPGQVGDYLIKNWRLLGHHALLTVVEVCAGLLVSLSSALLTGYGTHRSKKAQHSLLSFFLVMQAIPLFALLPLFVLWLGAGVPTKILVVALSSYFPMAASLIQGLRQCPQAYRDLGTHFRARPWAQWIHILLPSALPHLLNGMRIAAVHAPVTVLAADWIGSTEGLGYLIMLGHGRMQLDMMFACILIFVVLALALSGLVTLAQRWLLFWKTEYL